MWFKRKIRIQNLSFFRFFEYIFYIFRYIAYIVSLVIFLSIPEFLRFVGLFIDRCLLFIYNRILVKLGWFIYFRMPFSWQSEASIIMKIFDIFWILIGLFFYALPHWFISCIFFRHFYLICEFLRVCFYGAILLVGRLFFSVSLFLLLIPLYGIVSVLSDIYARKPLVIVFGNFMMFLNNLFVYFIHDVLSFILKRTRVYDYSVFAVELETIINILITFTLVFLPFLFIFIFSYILMASILFDLYNMLISIYPRLHDELFPQLGGFIYKNTGLLFVFRYIIAKWLWSEAFENFGYQPVPKEAKGLSYALGDILPGQVDYYWAFADWPTVFYYIFRRLVKSLMLYL